MMDFGEFLKSYLEGREKAYEVNPTDGNEMTRDAVLFILSEWDKRNQPVKHKPTQEIVDDFYKVLDAIIKPRGVRRCGCGEEILDPDNNYCPMCETTRVTDSYFMEGER